MTTPLVPFAATLPARGDGFYILDLSSWARAIYEGARSKGVDVDHQDADHVVKGVLRRLVDDVLVTQEPQYFAVAADVLGDLGGRRLLWPEYKAGRRAPGPGYERQINVLLELFACHRIPVFQASSFEADDYVAALTRRARACGLRVVLISKDHDLWQLFEDADPLAVLAWDVTTPRLYSTADCERVYGVPPSKLVELMALAGDGDEAPGIAGIGIKKASALLQRHGSLDRVLERWQWEKGKLATWLRDGAAAAHLSRELVTLAVSAPVHVPLQAVAFGWEEADTLRIWAAARKYGLPILLDARTTPKHVVEVELEERWAREPWPLSPAAESAATAIARAPEPVETPAAEGCQPCHPQCPSCAQHPRTYLTREELQASTCRHCGTALSEHSGPQIGRCAASLGLVGCNLLDWLRAPPEPWRALVALPPGQDGTLWKTPVGRWQLLVGRWARLHPATPTAPPVLALVIDSVAPPDDAPPTCTPTSRVLLSYQGRTEETLIPNALVDVYTAAPSDAPAQSPRARPQAGRRPLLGDLTPPPAATPPPPQLAFGW